MTEIIWTNCAEQMPPSGQMICMSDTLKPFISDGSYVRHVTRNGIYNKTLKWTPYTPEKWEELNK